MARKPKPAAAPMPGRRKTKMSYFKSLYRAYNGDGSLKNLIRKTAPQLNSEGIDSPKVKKIAGL